MNEYQDNKNCREKLDACKYEPIIALKIYDQRYLEECIRLGPVISEERCECIILKYEDDFDDFGRIILPERPICVPGDVKKAKILNDSFYIDKITISDISQSPVNDNYWDVTARFDFTFKLQLLNSCMRPLKIMCCDFGCKKNDKNIKNYINSSVSFVKQFTLFGGNMQSPAAGSDIFAPVLCKAPNSPHALAEAKAYPLDADLIFSCDCECNSEDLFDDTYDEPTSYVFITVGLNMVIKLFRFQSSGDALPKPYHDISENPCEFFESIDFPSDMFSPKF